MGAISKLVNNNATNIAGGGNNNNNNTVTVTNNNRLQLEEQTAKKSAVDLLPSTSSSLSSATPGNATSAIALTANGKPKEKRRNNEKRKERSRDAARCRRSRETEIFTELAQVLPLKKEDVQQLDKASVMRIAISYLKVRDMLKMFPKIQALCGDLDIPYSQEEHSEKYEKEENNTSTTNTPYDTENDDSQQSSAEEQKQENLEKSKLSTEENASAIADDDSFNSTRFIKQTLDGFLLILSNDGDITYVTDNISDYLGISKIDMLGQQIWEYAHQCDHAELKEALNIKRNGVADKVKDEHLLEEGISTDHRDLFVRLKCTLTSRGRSINIKSASYKVIHITGHLVVNTKGDRVLVAMGRPIPHPSNIEVPLGSTTFLTKHSLDMKFVYADDKMFNLLGYKPEDLLETSLFNYHHGIDSDSLMVTFKNVLSKGQGETSRYRFLGKYGGYCWIVTQATIVYDKLKPQSVVCVNYVISNLENKHEIYTLQQYEESQKLKLVEDIKGSNNNNNTGCNNKNEILNINTKEIKSAPQQQKAEKLEDNKEHKIEIPLNNNGNNKNIANNSNKPPEITENSFNSIQIKREQTPPVVVTAATTPNPITPNNSNNNTIEPQKPILYKNYNNNPTDNNNPSLLPQPIAAATGTTTNLHCPTTTVTRTIFENNKPPPPPPASTVTRAIFENKSLSKYADDKGPKTVTSSILRPATSAVLQHGVNLPTTTSTQAILQLQPTTTATALNVNPLGGAQSVTASVFAPRSQHIPLTTTTASIFAKHHQQQQQQQQNPQQQQTEAVNQQDMNKGYLTFAEDASELTMLKEEPDDLTAHLVAPNAVDACLPLDETTPLFSEMLVGLMGTYGGLLSDDISSLDSSNSASSNTDHSNNNCNSSSGSCPSPFSNHNGTAVAATTHSQHHQQQHQQQHHRQSPTLTMTNSSITNGNSNSNHNRHNNNNNSNSPVTNNTTNSTNIDPFINNNRDESNDTLCSQHLLSSPSASSKSPDGSSLPSLCSPNSLSQEDDFSYYTMNVDDMDDLTMRAPYIPMNEQDDLPLLTTDDFMWSSGNAFNADDFSLQTKETDNLQALQSSINQNINYQQQQFTQPQQQQQQYSSSLCSSPASAVSSMSPSSPMQQQQHQQQQQQQIQQNNSQQFLTSDSSELAALLCGTGSGSLSLLQDNSTNSSIGNCGGAAGVLVSNGGGGGSIGSTDSGVMLTDDLDNVSVASASSSANNLTQQQQQHEFQQQCLQQLQDQLQQQQRQQQQLLLSGLNISCKKEKFDGSANNGTPVSLTPSLCDSIEDSFDSVYNKNSSNLDCWSDFLQINNATDNSNNNTTTATTTPQHVTVTLENLRHEDCKQQIQMQLQQQQQQQQQQHQNIILNAVPLITIQSNNKNLIIPTTTQQPQQQSQNNSPNSLNSTQSNTKILNTKVNTIKLTPLTSTATIRIIENRQPLMQQQQQQQQQQNVVKTAFLHTTGGNKRHLSNSQLSNTSMDSKRMKGINAESTTTTSQLLQQLITTPQNGKQQQQAKDSKAMLTNNHNTNSNKWSSQNSNVVMAENKQQQQQQHQKQQRQQQQLSQQSNSVLKNLLISGCDKPQLQNTDILNNDESSMDQCLSPALAKPLKCLTNSATSSPTPNETGLLNYLNNPLICGPGVLPSPTLASMAVINDDSNPPGLTACPDIVEGANDSGIDDSIHENMSPLKRAYEGNDSTNQDKQQIKLNKNGLVMVAEVTPMAAVNQSNGGNDDDMGASICKRKRSISFLDSNNPLMATPFLMDLCNDDYVMSLGENYIDNVLNVWPEELA